MFPTTQNSTTDIAAMVAKSQVSSAPKSSGGKAFVKFGFETGEWTFGRDAENITGDVLIVNTASLQHGWTLWSNGKPHKNSAHFTQPLPMPMEAIGPDSPVESRSFEARFEDDAETVLDFSTNSMGGRKGCDDLLNAISIQAVTEPEYLFPVVELSSNSYASAKRGGKHIHNPEFKIVGWVNTEGNKLGDKPAKLEVVEAEEVEEVEEVVAPKRRRRSKA